MRLHLGSITHNPINVHETCLDISAPGQTLQGSAFMELKAYKQKNIIKSVLKQISDTVHLRNQVDTAEALPLGSRGASEGPAVSQLRVCWPKTACKCHSRPEVTHKTSLLWNRKPQEKIRQKVHHPMHWQSLTFTWCFTCAASTGNLVYGRQSVGGINDSKLQAIQMQVFNSTVRCELWQLPVLQKPWQ